MNPKIKTVGGLPIKRKVDLLKTDVAATFARIRKEQAAVRKEVKEKVRPLKKRVA